MNLDSDSTAIALERRIRRVATALGIDLSDEATRTLAVHAESVIAAPHELHLTSIRDPEEFVERHVGEALQGAAMLHPEATGTLLDLGSGNGYPGLPIAALRPGLRLLLTEASRRKAKFLREEVAQRVDAEVLCAQVQRAQDLHERGPLDVVVTRAMGGWEKILPRLHAALAENAQLLVWAGESMEAVVGRSAWRRFELRERRTLAGRERSWIWHFTLA